MTAPTCCRFSPAVVEASRRFGCYPESMAKRTSTKDTEALLGELVAKVSPAELRVHLPKFAVIRERAAYEITAATRGCTISWCGNTFAEAAQEGLDYLETPVEDPFRSCWKRTTRMQREFVRTILSEHGSRETAKAIVLKMRGKYAEANIAFELADALHAAGAELDHEDTDEDGGMLPVDPLTG